MDIKKIIHKAKDYYIGEYFFYESMMYNKRRKYSMSKQTRVQSFVIQYRRALQDKKFGKIK